MCAPVVGALSLASGVMGAVGQHQSASASAAAQNQAAISNYKYQLKVRRRNWDRERERYAHQVTQYKTQSMENEAAANRAYVSEQQRLNNIYKKASFAKQDQLVKLAQSTGQMASRGATGKSAQRLDTSVVSQFGRNQAIMAESLLGAQQAYTTRTDGIRRELIGAQNKAFSDVAYAPEPGVAPPPPTMTPGPSGLGLMAGVLGAGVGAVDSFRNAGGELPKF